MSQDQRPRLVRFEITGRCSLNCRHCYVSRGTTRTREMDLATVKRVLDGVVGPGERILFLGGEPFQRADMPEIIRHAKSRGGIVGVDTNALHLDPATIRQLAGARLDKLNFTVYGTSASAHEAFTRPGHFGRIMDAVRAAKEAGIAVDLAFMLTRRNFAELFKLRGFGRALGVQDIHLDIFLSTDDEQIDALFELTPVQFALFWGFLRPFLLRFLSSTGAPGQPATIKVSFCEKQAVPLIKPDGQVWPCLFYPRPFANILTEDPAAVWERFARFEYDRDVCGHCVLRKVTGPVRRVLSLIPPGLSIEMHRRYGQLVRLLDRR